LFYAALLNRKILVFIPAHIRRQIDQLKTQFREAATSKGQNVSYKTHGLLVPLEYAENHIAEKVIDL
jgi:hypothetical protein